MLWNFGIADYYFVDPSSIAVDRNTNSSLNITNTVTLSDGTVVGGRPVSPGVDAEGNPITITQLNEPFNVLNIGTDLTIPTGLKFRTLSRRCGRSLTSSPTPRRITTRTATRAG